LIATEQRRALAPAATANDLAVHLCPKIRAVLNKLRIDAEHVDQGALDLLVV